MPTIFRSGPYRLFFYASDWDEPPHVHVERDERKAKFWLDPVRLQFNKGFRPIELRQVERLVDERQVELMEGWHAYFEG
ncbi:MAG TPA: DUF4160 domain-containing protein [Chloroflexota bacterium]|jgi:hypothetical protein